MRYRVKSMTSRSRLVSGSGLGAATGQEADGHLLRK